MLCGMLMHVCTSTTQTDNSIIYSLVFLKQMQMQCMEAGVTNNLSSINANISIWKNKNEGVGNGLHVVSMLETFTVNEK